MCVCVKIVSCEHYYFCVELTLAESPNGGGKGWTAQGNWDTLDSGADRSPKEIFGFPCEGFVAKTQG